MFYLLKNNRIIDTSEISKNVDEIYVEKDDKGQKNLYISYYLGLKNLGVIKKKSKSVFNLIEVGDLIIGNMFDRKEDFVYMCKKIEKDKIIYNDGDYEDYFNYNPKEWFLWKEERFIRKIYKPNEKGDYIKVWEKKNE